MSEYAPPPMFHVGFTETPGAVKPGVAMHLAIIISRLSLITTSQLSNSVNSTAKAVLAKRQSRVGDNNLFILLS
jgi:hypothetical protein